MLKGTKSPIPKSMLALVINCCGGSQKGEEKTHSQLFHNSESSRGKRTEDQGGLGGLKWEGCGGVEESGRSLGGEGPYGMCRI